MSFYDTLRCIWHDPRYVWDLHGGDIVGGVAVVILVFVMWGL
jgi:hypothetical protein